MRGRAAGVGGPWCGRLLLLAALLLGIVTMHTLGHPTGHGRPETGTSASPTTAGGHHAEGHHAGGPHAAPAGRPVPLAVGRPVSAPAAPSPHHHPSLNPSSVCLAVLGAGAGWAVVLLLALAVLRRPAGA
ncbi:hypothetical protein, partial [Streptomyces huiliensis]|uniref:hypothetical protein n=1 Tax=Streptomyces huiliensis TaxID=2876027 RepID=UPI001CBEDD81